MKKKRLTKHFLLLSFFPSMFREKEVMNEEISELEKDYQKQLELIKSDDLHSKQENIALICVIKLSKLSKEIFHFC